MHPDQIMVWQGHAMQIRADIAAKRQALRADPASGQDDPFRTGLDAAFDSLSTTLKVLEHLWLLADLANIER